MEIWELTIRFFSLVDPNVRTVLMGSVLLGATTGALGTFTFLQRRSLIGDALAHAALPGVCLSFMIVGRKDFFILLLGAGMTAWLGAMALDFITRHTRIKQDAALGLVLTFFFGVGIVLLTHIQKSGLGTQAGLDKFLFGQASALTLGDIKILAITTLVMGLILILGFNYFKLFTFDPEMAGALGLHVGWLRFLMTTMTTAAVVIGLQAVGVVLMAAMLIAPAAAARQWTDNLKRMVILASIFGIVAGVMGAYVSFLAPNLPTGPWMVVSAFTVFLISIVFSPRRGMLSRFLLHLKNRRKMTDENILKVLFKKGQPNNSWSDFFPESEIRHMWSFVPDELSRGLRALTKRKLLERSSHMFRLTEDGVTAGAVVLRRHRLWEVYLTRYLGLPGDHVHRDAEDMEHILTPELESELEQLLGHPERDPHHQDIPYLREDSDQ